MPGFDISGNGDSPSHKAEFHRAHRWSIVDIGAPPERAVTSASSPTSSALNMVTKSFYAKSLQLPTITFEEVKVKAGSVTYKFPKRAEWENVTVEFYDVYGLHSLFNNWMSRIWTARSGIGLASDFMGSPIFELSDGMGERKQKFTLLNAYPLSVKHSELSYASSEIKLLSIVYSYSHAEIELFDA